MGVTADISGIKFGRLTAISILGINRHGARLWLWRCDCGREIERVAYPIQVGRSVSCGCHKNEQSRRRALHGQWETRTYRAWIEMKARVRGKDESSVRNYSNRGIAVHPSWEKSFQQFWSDMGDCPVGMTLERKYNDGNYEPGNCRWATQHDQTRNTRRTIRVIVRNREICLKDACVLLGVPYDRIRARIRNGRVPQEALDAR